MKNHSSLHLQRALYCAIFGTLVVLVTVSLNSVIASQRFDTFLIDTQLSVNNYSIELGNESRICPSNDCKIIVANWFFDREGSLKSTHLLYINVDFRLHDNKTNGHLTPKKQELVEQMSLEVFCPIQDIEENGTTTKYICHDSSIASFFNGFNHTSYNYNANMTFELPSRHLIVQGFGQS